MCFMLTIQFVEKYKHLQARRVATAASSGTRNKKTTSTGRKNVDDTDSETDGEDKIGYDEDPTTLWLAEWNSYRDTREVVADDMGIVPWWGYVYLFF